MASARRQLCQGFSKADTESCLLNGFGHALQDAYICFAFRPASPAALLSRPCISSFKCLGILIPQDYLLDRFGLPGTQVTSNGLVTASLSPIEHYKANCSQATPDSGLASLEIVQSLLDLGTLLHSLDVPHVSMGSVSHRGALTLI